MKPFADALPSNAVPPVITGTVGGVPNHEFEAFEARLDAVDAGGVIVERLQPDQAMLVIAENPSLQRLVTNRGTSAFPIVLVNDDILSSGRYPTNTEWAHALGAGKRAEEATPTH